MRRRKSNIIDYTETAQKAISEAIKTKGTQQRRPSARRLEELTHTSKTAREMDRDVLLKIVELNDKCKSLSAEMDALMAMIREAMVK